MTVSSNQEGSVHLLLCCLEHPWKTGSALESPAPSILRVLFAPHCLSLKVETHATMFSFFAAGSGYAVVFWSH